MCRKQAAGPIAARAGGPCDALRVTRGTVAQFRSAADARRGFCRHRGTPLTCEALSRPRIGVTIGTLGRRAERCAVRNLEIEAMTPWPSDIPLLPATATGEGCTPLRFALVRQTDPQHPDRDTAVWPAEPA
jgi:hypothetical protein